MVCLQQMPESRNMIHCCGNVATRSHHLKQRTNLSLNRVPISLLPYGTVAEEASALTLNRQMKLKNTTEEIVTKLKQNVKLSQALSKINPSLEEHLSQLVFILIQKKIAPRQIVHFLTKVPQLLEHSVKSWEEAMSSAENFGFTQTQLLPAIADIPQMFGGKVKQVYLMFDALRAIGFYESQIRKMILEYPFLLDHSPQTIINNYQQLLQHYPKSDLAKMILRAPKILATSPSESLEKLLYVRNEMGIPMKYLVTSNFLCHDLLHIETRHRILERSGLYEKPDKHGSTKIENPTFRSIVDTDDRYFGKKVARLTLEEYKIFADLYSVEKEDISEEWTSDVESDDEE